MPQDINQDRCRFTPDAAERGIFDPADAQSSTRQPADLPTIKDTRQDKRAARRMTPAALHLPIEGELPSLGGATEWLNAPPLTAAGLRGNVVLVEFWTYSSRSLAN